MLYSFHRYERVFFCTFGSFLSTGGLGRGSQRHFRQDRISFDGTSQLEPYNNSLEGRIEGSHDAWTATTFSSSSFLHFDFSVGFGIVHIYPLFPLLDGVFFRLYILHAVAFWCLHQEALPLIFFTLYKFDLTFAVGTRPAGRRLLHGSTPAVCIYHVP
jgi:hypothetical protein